MNTEEMKQITAEYSTTIEKSWSRRWWIFHYYAVTSVDYEQRIFAVELPGKRPRSVQFHYGWGRWPAPLRGAPPNSALPKRGID